MNRKIMFGLAVLFLLAMSLSADDGAYYRDYRYVDYFGRPVYRAFGRRSDGSYHYRYYDDEEYEKIRAARFLKDSWYGRYDDTSGKSSGEAFCYGCKTNGNPSNWGNKQSYDLLSEGVGTEGDYYYKPRYDYQSQTWNWRF